MAGNGILRCEPVPARDGTTIETAIFVPNKFHVTPGVDMILYFHGMTRHYGSSTLAQYIAEKDFTALFDAVGADGRFALVFPWLGKSPNSAGIQERITKSVQDFEAYLTAVI